MRCSSISLKVKKLNEEKKLTFNIVQCDKNNLSDRIFVKFYCEFVNLNSKTVTSEMKTGRQA